MANQTGLLQALGWAVLNSFWQLALLWIIYKMAVLLSRGRWPAAKAALASFSLFAGFAWFIYTFIAALSDVAATEKLVTGYFLSENKADAVARVLQNILPGASIIYLVLLTIPVFRFFQNMRYVGMVRSTGISKIHVSWRLFVKRTAARMGIRRDVTVWISELVQSPVTVGFLKPVILMPVAVVNHLSAEQMEAVLLHELAHIRRMDYLLNLLLNFIRTILYFNPFARLFVREVERERELSCDEMVMQFQYNSHEYASALLLLEQAGRSDGALVMQASGKRYDLLYRVESILGIAKTPAASFRKLAGLFAGLLGVIVFNAFLFMSKPVADRSEIALLDMNSPVEMLAVEPASDISSEELALSKLVAAVMPAVHHTLSNKLSSLQAALFEIGATTSADNPDVRATCETDEAEKAAPLSEQKEAQIQQAIAASRRVFEEAKWNTIENQFAEVFSEKEKQELKATYEKAMAKMDWSSWENKLRSTFDKIDWERVNNQLSNAVSMVRIDSLQNVYTSALSRIDKARAEMAEQQLSGIPDSDITLKELEKKRQEIQVMNNYLRSLRLNKVIRL